MALTKDAPDFVEIDIMKFAVDELFVSVTDIE